MERSKNTESTTTKPTDDAGCRIEIQIDSQGDVNIYNCTTPSGTGETPPSPYPPDVPVGTCIPVVAGAKHKLSREYKLAKLAERVRVPSSLATSTMHMARRFLLGKAAANPLEAAAFTTLGRISRDTLSCTVAGVRRAAAAPTQPPVRAVPHPRPGPSDRRNDAVHGLGAGDHAAGRCAGLR